TRPAQRSSPLGALLGRRAVVQGTRPHGAIVARRREPPSGRRATGPAAATPQGRWRARQRAARRTVERPSATRSPPGRAGGGSQCGALDLAGLEARGAHVEALRGPVHHRAHALDVRVPPTARPHVGVRDALAEAGVLAADVAGGSHGLLLNLLPAHDLVVVDV